MSRVLERHLSDQGSRAAWVALPVPASAFWSSLGVRAAWVDLPDLQRSRVLERHLSDQELSLQALPCEAQRWKALAVRVPLRRQEDPIHHQGVLRWGGSPLSEQSEKALSEEALFCDQVESEEAEKAQVGSLS